MINIENYKTITQTQAHDSRSNRYAFISTKQVLDRFDQAGWYVDRVSESGTRSTAGYQSHIVRLRHHSFQPSNIILNETVFPEIVLFNNHLGTSSFRLSLGFYRQVCSNGLCVGDDILKRKIKHIGYKDQEVDSAINDLMLAAPKIIEKVQAMRSVELTQNEKEALAESAIELKWNGTEYSIDPRNLLRPLRYSERNNNDLWTTFNTIQEHVIKGGVRQTRADGSRIRSRAVRDLKEDIRLNEGLWKLTERMMQLKAA